LEPTTNQVEGFRLAEAQQQWQAVLGELQLQMTRATFDTWLRGSQVISCENGTYTIFVHHAYAVDWLQNRLLSIIQRTLRRRAGPNVEVAFTASRPEREEDLVLVAETVPVEAPPAVRSKAHPTGTPQGQGPAEAALHNNGQASTSLNVRYTFESFVVGTSNRLAHAACVAVAENPAHAYNPLFLYGGVGLGKTHLLHAVGHIAQQRHLSVLYVSSEGFTNDLINAIRTQKTEEFRVKYRNSDILLVDDIQFLAGKERTQEEFFHTFNTLHGAGKQIILSCDRPPRSLVALEDRLRSRFGWGLIADIQPPDFETRAAILRAKADRSGVKIPEEILGYIAHKVPSNIRELEGALNRMLACVRLMNAPFTISTAREILDSILMAAPDLSPKSVLSTVARHYHLSEEQLTGPSRVRSLSVPRQLAMYLIREETGTSLPQIGQLLGGRDHTTILHGCEKIGNQIETDEQLRRDWLAIKRVLSEGNGAQK
jgi:chromosomal replication initiator protein